MSNKDLQKRHEAEASFYHTTQKEEDKRVLTDEELIAILEATNQYKFVNDEMSRIKGRVLLFYDCYNEDTSFIKSNYYTLDSIMSWIWSEAEARGKDLGKRKLQNDLKILLDIES